jgi:Domain of unknown function (DUF4189)
VGHPDAVEVWAIWDSASSLERVKADVLAACNRAMGSGCSFRTSGTNGTIVVLRTPNNELIHGWGGDAQEAEKEARKDCKKLGIECAAYKIFTAKPWKKRIGGNEPDRIKTYFPDPAKVVPYVAVVAWPGERTADQQWHGKSWVSSGIKGRTNAEREAIYECSKDSGTKCVIGAVSLGGALVTFSNNRDPRTFWFALSSTKYLKSAQERCRVSLQGAQCTMMSMYDAQTRRMIIVDDRPIAR